MWVPLVENNEHHHHGADYFIKKNIHALIEKGKIIGETVPFNPASNKTLGFEAGVDYFINKNKKSSIVTGVHIGFAPRAFTYLVTKDLLPPPLTQDIFVNGSNLFPLFYVPNNSFQKCLFFRVFSPSRVNFLFPIMSNLFFQSFFPIFI